MWLSGQNWASKINLGLGLGSDFKMRPVYNCEITFFPQPMTGVVKKEIQIASNFALFEKFSNFCDIILIFYCSNCRDFFQTTVQLEICTSEKLILRKKTANVAFFSKEFSGFSPYHASREAK